MEVLKLFLTFLKVGAFSFGGGYAMLPLIRKEIVEISHWLTPSEFNDIIGISQATPGPIAINSATYVGFKTAGVIGSIAATLGVVTVSFILVLIASHYMEQFKTNRYFNAALLGMRPALIGLILSAAFSSAGDVYLPISPDSIKAIIIGLITIFLLVKTKIHPILVIVLSAVLGFLFYGII